MTKLFSCKNCNVDDFDIVMIKDELWLSIAKQEDFLCDKCMEKALGRSITEADFKSPGIPCNEFWKWNKLSQEQQEKSMSDFKKLNTPELRENFRVQFPEQPNH